jgi:hypothetical protein
MTSFYQEAFDLLYQLSKRLPGGRLTERMSEWEERRQHSSVTHTNHVVCVEFSWKDRPVLLTFQDDPQPPERPGVEVFLTNKKIQGDCLIRRRTFGDALWPFGKLRSPSPELFKRIVCTWKAGGQPTARRLVDNQELVAPLQSIAWEEGFTLSFQDGAGVGLLVPAHRTLGLSQAALDELLARLTEILLILG